MKTFGILKLLVEETVPRRELSMRSTARLLRFERLRSSCELFSFLTRSRYAFEGVQRTQWVFVLKVCCSMNTSVWGGGIKIRDRTQKSMAYNRIFYSPFIVSWKQAVQYWPTASGERFSPALLCHVNEMGIRGSMRIHENFAVFGSWNRTIGSEIGLANRLVWRNSDSFRKNIGIAYLLQRKAEMKVTWPSSTSAVDDKLWWQKLAMSYRMT